MYVSLPLPADVNITVSVTVIPRITAVSSTDAVAVREPRILRIRVPRKCRLNDLLHVAASETGIRTDAFLISDVYKHKVCNR